MATARQTHPNLRAHAKLAGDIELALGPLDDVLDDGKAKPGAARRPAAPWICAVKAAGQVGEMVGRYAGAMIGHRHLDHLARGRRQTHMHGRIGVAIFQCIIDEVAQQLLQLFDIAGHKSLAIGALQFHPAGR